MDQQAVDILRALAWHAQVQTYLLIALAAGTLAGFWAIGRDMRAISRLVGRPGARD